MHKTGNSVDPNVRVKRWYEGWKAIIGFVAITILVFSAGMQFNDWMFGIYTVSDADEDHRILSMRDSLLSVRISVLEDQQQDVANILYEMFCYMRRSQTDDLNVAWNACVRRSTAERVESLTQ